MGYETGERIKKKRENEEPKGEKNNDYGNENPFDLHSSELMRFLKKGGVIVTILILL
jgi:hypothetical protein